MNKFEIKLHDGMSRIGSYEKNGVKTDVPAVTDVEAMFPDLAGKKCANIPLGAPKDFISQYFESYEGIVQVHPAVLTDVETGDCVMVSNWHTTLNNPRNYVNWLISLKQKIPPDTMWYAPASALPSNVASLIYSGFDLFDFRAVDLKTVQGLFCAVEGEFPADEWMKSEICGCAGCMSGDLKVHNRSALQQEIALVKQFIKRRQIRELMENRCRNSAHQVSIMRLFDESYDFVEPHIPVVRSVQFMANSAESIKRPEIRRFSDRVIERFIPSRTDVCVIIPCSARKPYSLSQSHRKFQAAIQNRAHELIITSPLGIVPRELERIYPAAHYDIPVTGYWDLEEKAFITDVLARYLGKHKFGRVIAHLDGDTLEIVRDAAARCGIEIESTCSDSDRPVSRNSLNALDTALDGCRKKRPNIIRGTLSWQFGTSIDTRDLVLKGRLMRQKVIKGRMQLFSIDPETGLFRPTFDGWKLIDTGYRVYIDDFVPHGDILAPGVMDADPRIREGDEVFVQGESACATGKAIMGASEMLASKRGVAVRVRKIKKL